MMKEAVCDESREHKARFQISLCVMVVMSPSQHIPSLTAGVTVILLMVIKSDTMKLQAELHELKNEKICVI